MTVNHGSHWYGIHCSCIFMAMASQGASYQGVCMDQKYEAKFFHGCVPCSHNCLISIQLFWNTSSFKDLTHAAN